jgi:hypothetical protein
VFVTVDRVEGLFDQRIPWRPYRRVPFAGHGVAACVVLEVSVAVTTPLPATP